MLKLMLTERQAERLRLVLWNMDDEGPEGEGWPSVQLEQLRVAVGYPVTWGRENTHGVDFDSLPGDDLPPISGLRS